MKPKILHIDIETAPTLGWVWGLWEQNVVAVERPWYILSVAWAWNDGPVKCFGLVDYPQYKKSKEDDTALMEHIWNLLDTADIVIAHNGDNFDLPKINARFLKHGMLPPEPYKTVDTLKVCRRYFKMDSNRLDSVAKYLAIGSKLPHTGIDLWQGCMRGDTKSWGVMKRYNKHDVVLLREVYKKLLPWITNHPNYNVYSEENGCPNCGGKKIQRRGFDITRTGRKQRFHCQNPKCGAWSYGRSEKVTDIR